MSAASLFPVCPLPGCANLTTHPATPCAACQEAFGPMLQPAGQAAPAEEVRAELEQRDRDVAAILAARAPDRYKANQLCWVCQERHPCRVDPEHPDRRICRSCVAL